MNELAKLDPKDFGLEESSVATIEQAFQPKIIERDALMSSYEALIDQELTPELCKEFHNLRLKFVKVRTGIAEIHKTQKAYFLAAGRFVDAWKNKETLPVEQCEEKLEDGEKHFERIEEQFLAEREVSRTSELSKYTDLFPNGLGLLSDASFAIYLSGAKVAYEARIAAEAKAEEDKVAGEKAAKDEQERIRTENIRLQKLADESAAKQKAIEDAAATERKRQEDLLAAERKSADDERQAQQLALATERAKAEAERKAVEDAAAKQKADSDESLRLERLKTIALAAEIKAKADADAEAIRKAKAAPDIDKLKKLADDIDKMEMPEIGNPAAAQVLATVKELLTKTTKYLREKINTL